jgi:hypothetical protein
MIFNGISIAHSFFYRSMIFPENLYPLFRIMLSPAERGAARVTPASHKPRQSGGMRELPAGPVPVSPKPQAVPAG